MQRRRRDVERGIAAKLVGLLLCEYRKVRGNTIFVVEYKFYVRENVPAKI